MALVYGQMNEPRAPAPAALYRPDAGRAVPRCRRAPTFCFLDNIFRSTQAGSEVSALLAVSPRPWLPADAGHRHGPDAGAITSTKAGSITSIQAVYVPADDLTDPAPATTFAHLDATTVLSRAISELGIYPAVDPLDSTSRLDGPADRG